MPDTVVFVPYYMPVTHEKFSWPSQRLLDEAFGYLQRINPALTADDVIDSTVARLTLRAAGLPAGLRREDPAGADADCRAADRRHLLLLS